MKGTRFPELEHRLPGYGAFKAEDAGDAQRREPASDLRPYAEARGLETIPLERPPHTPPGGVARADLDRVLGLARNEGLGQL